MAIPRSTLFYPLCKTLPLTSLFTAIASFSPIAFSDVLYEHSFSNGIGSFTSSGQTRVTGNNVKIRGGSNAGSIESSPVSINASNSVTIKVSQTTSGLDDGESAIASISINGADFEPLDETGSASGQAIYSINNDEPIQTVALKFGLNANGYFESYTIRSVTIEGDKGTGSGSENEGDNENDGANSSASVIIPDDSWTCNLPEGIPDPSRGELVFKTTMEAGEERNVGLTPYGDRRIIPVNGGNIISGQFGNAPLKGSVNGNALEFNLHLPSGAIEHESRYVITDAEDNLIYLRNCGVADGDNIRFVADFEANSEGAYAWLNQGTYVGVREKVGNKVTLSVYANPSVSEEDEVVQVEADNDLRQQPWECPAAAPPGEQGNEVLVADVGIGGFQAVGKSKYGTRRIVPITGGSFTGDLGGSVDEGGADFQLTQNGSLSIEARYTLKAENGEWISMRNCGDFAVTGLLNTIPILEAKVDGAYSYLNDAQYIGTIKPRLGRVIISVFEEQ